MNPIQTEIALATIGDSLNQRHDFYIMLPANLVDALLGVARVGADILVSGCCICETCDGHPETNARRLGRALADVVEYAQPI